MLRVLVLSSRWPDAVRPLVGKVMERQALELAARPGVEVEVAAPIGLPPFPFSRMQRHARFDPVGAEEIRNGLRVSRPRYRTIPRLHVSQPFSMARTLLPHLRRTRARFPFDVIAAQFFWPEGPAAVRLAEALQVPVSIKGRGPDVALWAERRGPGRMIVDAGRRADGMLAISADLRRHMAALGMPEERIEVHYTGVDRSRFHPLGRAAEKAKLGVSGPLLLSVGNLIPRKGHERVVEALSHLPGATLIVAGSGPGLEALSNRVRALGLEDRVRLVGSVPHEAMPALYSAADVTVHAASLEGFANVRVESLACGTPVVSTPAGGADELIRSAEAGRIVPPDARAIAAAAAELIENPPLPEAVARAIDAFTWARNAARLEAHLRTLAQRGRRPA
ncbi:MAG TPA: glycosyltransferase [Allosphingosinicella sp.]|jgi:glycosyltransferase involved in cell wall biosynthesis|nr:glycosyltransferase [Allosphingosinicella sp.]